MKNTHNEQKNYFQIKEHMQKNNSVWMGWILEISTFYEHASIKIAIHEHFGSYGISYNKSFVF